MSRTTNNIYTRNNKQGSGFWKQGGGWMDELSLWPTAFVSPQSMVVFKKKKNNTGNPFKKKGIPTIRGPPNRSTKQIETTWYIDSSC